MMNRLFLCISLCLGSSVASADFIGLYIGAGSWRADFSGEVLDVVSVSSDLALNRAANLHAYVALEHPVPLLPNVRLARSEVSDSGEGTLSSAFSFEGVGFVPDQQVTTDLDMTHTDVTLYYELWDTGLDFDAGVTFRLLDGSLAIDGVRQEITAPIPLAYLRWKQPLPFTGLYLGADVHGIGFSESKITDLALRVGWETENFILPEFGIEGGYRRWTIDGDADDIDVGVDVEVDGFFVNLTAHF